MSRFNLYASKHDQLHSRPRQGSAAQATTCRWQCGTWYQTAATYSMDKTDDKAQKMFDTFKLLVLWRMAVSGWIAVLTLEPASDFFGSLGTCSYGQGWEKLATEVRHT